MRSFLIISFLFIFSPLAIAQEPSRETTADLKRAVVIVTTYDKQGKPLLQGSGFFVSPDRIVTNLHVVRNAGSIRIKTFEGRAITVQTVVATDASADLALLQTERCPDAKTLLVEDATPVEGEAITVISSPQGSHWKVTHGRVGTMWQFEGAGARIQITASIFPGSSGGPVLNQQGRVIGIAAMHTGVADDLNFAVPAESLKALQLPASVFASSRGSDR
jgi:S1-C subfamily serine protease